MANFVSTDIHNIDHSCLARAVVADIKRCAEALEPAPLKRIHIVLATSDIHLEHKLRITREECVKRAVEAIQLAKTLCGDVEFSPEDAGRSDEDFLCHILGKCIEAGARTLNIPDTVGYNTPDEYGRRIKYLIDNTHGSQKVHARQHYSLFVLILKLGACIDATVM